MPRTSPKYVAAIYLFNRDLRSSDNELLLRASREAAAVYAVFIFTPEQISRNTYANPRAVQFLARSLRELDKDIPIAFFHGDTVEVIRGLARVMNAKAIYNNMDVTPYASARTASLMRLCEELGVSFIQGRDVFMGRHCDLTKANGSPYLKFTPFVNNAQKLVKDETVTSRTPPTVFMRAPNETGRDLLATLCGEECKGATPVFVPGRSGAVKALKRFARSPIVYGQVHDQLASHATSHLSAYLHYGILGPNEIVRALVDKRNAADITRQLLWREFFLYIVWKQHTDYTKASRTIPAQNRVRWLNSSAHLSAWCTGNTGCPIVDAGMREMAATGYMQNRARMITAMYLIYYLRLDWRLGEAHFARSLIDYDYCNNIGGWFWCAGWEVYSNDWFRPFSMASQMERFDPRAEYVKLWVPEVRAVEPRDLWDWSKNRVKYPDVVYAEPLITDMGAARAAGIAAYKAAHA